MHLRRLLFGLTSSFQSIKLPVLYYTRQQIPQHSSLNYSSIEVINFSVCSEGKIYEGFLGIEVVQM